MIRSAGYESMSDTSQELIFVGAITGVRGLKGEVRIKSFTADPKAISSYGDVFEENGRKSYTIKITGQAKGQVLARLGGIADRTAAEALKGTRLYVPKSALPEPEEDEFYFDDLVGLRADLVDGGELVSGIVEEVSGREAPMVMVNGKYYDFEKVENVRE